MIVLNLDIALTLNLEHIKLGYWDISPWKLGYLDNEPQKLGYMYLGYCRPPYATLIIIKWPDSKDSKF